MMLSGRSYLHTNSMICTPSIIIIILLLKLNSHICTICIYTCHGCAVQICTSSHDMGLQFVHSDHIQICTSITEVWHTWLPRWRNTNWYVVDAMVYKHRQLRASCWKIACNRVANSLFLINNKFQVILSF